MIVDANFEPSWAPIDEFDVAFALHRGNCRVNVLRHDVAAIEQAAGNVLALAGVALNHLIGRLEALGGDLRDGHALVICLVHGYYWRVSGEGKVDSRIWHEVGLILGEVDVECTVETQRGGDGRDHLADETIEIGVAGTPDAQLATANVVDGLVVDHEGAVRVLHCHVSGEYGVVRLNDGG